MKNINEILGELGIAVPEDKQTELTRLVNENYKTISEFGKVTAKRDEYKLAKETAEETLKGFEGIDPTKIQGEIDSWKQKAQQAAQDAQKKLDERDFNDALRNELDKLKFTSAAARKAVEADIRSMDLKLHDGRILGISDAIESIKNADASAFVDEQQAALENGRPKFTDPNSSSGSRKATSEELGKMSVADYIAARKRR